MIFADPFANFGIAVWTKDDSKDPDILMQLQNTAAVLGFCTQI